MQEPQEVLDGEHEQVLTRVAAIDVAKASGMVCTRVPHPEVAGRRVTKVWSVSATTNAILELADHLVEVGVERVTVESTSDYWRPFLYLLEARGLQVWLVNATEVKNVPGRPKTDKLDAVWLAKLTERGMLRPSFVPPTEIRVLRDYTRLRADLTVERSRHAQRLEKLCEDALIKLSTVATDMMGVSGRAMIEALIAGERDPQVLADLARGRMRVKHAALVQALTGRFDAHHAELARMLLDSYDSADAHIRRLNERIETLIAAMPAAQGVDADGTTGPHTGSGPDAPVLPALARLDEIPGVGTKTAQVILAEIGLDMTRFPTATHLVSWARLSPRTVQSGPRHRAPAPGPGTGPGGPARATPNSKVSSARPPQPRRRPTPSSAPATDAWSNDGANSKPSSRSPAPSSPSPGTCSRTPTPATTTSAPTTTPARSTPHAAPAATSANSRPSATQSPSLPLPNRGHQRLTVPCFPISHAPPA